MPISTITYSLSVAYEKIFELPLPANVFVTSKTFIKMLKNGKMHIKDVINADKTKFKSSNAQDDKASFINNCKDKDGDSEVVGQKPGDELLGNKVSRIFYFLLENRMLVHPNRNRSNSFQLRGL